MAYVSHTDLALIRELNYHYFGNHLSDQKEQLILNRIKKLFRSQSQYLTIHNMLKAIEKGEFVQEFINIFTTNKTSFFRELVHFKDLQNRVLPEFFLSNSQIKVYSCASSTGEEAYSIAITFLHYNSKQEKQLQAKIYATDIDTSVIEKAKEGIYQFHQSKSPFPSWVNPRLYFQRRITDENSNILIRANESLRSLVYFKNYNLLNNDIPFPNTQFDVIFCRNVLIYFDETTQEKILKKLFAILRIGGTFYTGHAETPLCLYNYVEKIAPSIYKKKSNITEV